MDVGGFFTLTASVETVWNPYGNRMTSVEPVWKLYNIHTASIFIQNRKIGYRLVRFLYGSYTDAVWVYRDAVRVYTDETILKP